MPPGAPIGADGRRPLLSASWAGVAARHPTPQPAAAPAVGSEGSTTNGAQSRQQPPPRQQHPQQPVGASLGRGQPLDGEGFTLVQRRSTATQPSGPGAPTDDGPGGGGGNGDVGEAAAEGNGDDMAVDPPRQYDGEAPHAEAGGGTQDEAGEQPPTADELKARLERHRRHLAWVDAEGFGTEDPVRIHAADMVAEAEARWRAATPGVAVAQRVLWAERAVRRARRVQSNQEQAIAELDDWYEGQRHAMHERLGELRARTRSFEDRLAMVSREAAAEYAPGDAPGSAEAGDEMRDVVVALEGQVGPAMRAILDLAPEGSPMRNGIAAAMGSLDSLYAMAAAAANAQRATRYDITDAEGDEWDGAYGGVGGYRGQAHYDDEGWWSSSHGGNGWWHDRGTYGWSSGGDDAAAWWGGDGPAAGLGSTLAMDTADVQVPTWMRAESTEAGAWDVRAWKRGRFAGAHPQGMQGRHGICEEAAGDHERMAQLQAHQTDAAAAAAVAPTGASGSQGALGPAPPTPLAADHAKAALDRRKEEIWHAAQDEEVEVTLDQILAMGAEELEAWAAAHIQGI